MSRVLMTFAYENFNFSLSFAQATVDSAKTICQLIMSYLDSLRIAYMEIFKTQQQSEQLQTVSAIR